MLVIHHLEFWLILDKINKIQIMKKKSTSQNHENNQQQQIKVFIRVRPLKSQFSKKSLKVIDHGVALNFKDKIHQLSFDGVCDQSFSQSKVFEDACLPILKNVLGGNNACLFVYGQTGTGKTYTMGTLEAIKSEDQGLIPLTLNYLISHLSSNLGNGEWSISLSFMQIYMEQIIDLLNPRNNKLQIREDLEYGETYVEDLVIVPITNYHQSIDLINAGLQYRKVGNQKMNQLSSRSHTIFTIYISQKISNNEYMSSTFSLIDLAGSERVKKSNSTGIRLQQAKFINTSLSALGNVISGLSENNSQKFIPYRSSKLTRILKSSLLGRSKVSVICTVQPSEENTYQTYSTLLFADRCKQIRLQNQPIINIQTFQELNHQRDLKAALERSAQKEKQYVELIKNLQDNSKGSLNSQRENQLCQVIDGIYKLFGEINEHLKKTLQGPKLQQSPKKERPTVNSFTSISSIKSHLTSLAQQTIDHINTLSSMAFGEDGKGIQTSNRLQTQTLISLLLDSMRHNVKLFESNLIKEGKQSLEKEIQLDEYEKQRKQEVLSKIRLKKLKGLQNSFEEIWAQNHTSSNPLQSLLNNIRRGEMGFYDRAKKEENDAQHTNPKQFLKMLTKQQSERKHREMLIEDEEKSYRQAQQDDKLQYMQQSKPISSSQIKYFKNRNTGSKVRSDNPSNSQFRQDSKQTNSEIKKLLDSLIASKSNYEEKKKINNGQS